VQNQAAAQGGARAWSCAAHAAAAGGHDGHGQRWAEFSCAWPWRATGRRRCTTPGVSGRSFARCAFRRLLWAVWPGGVGPQLAGLSYRSWAAALLLPLTIAGFRAASRAGAVPRPGQLLAGCLCTGWLVFDAAKLALVGLVLADALVNFRQRWARHGGGTAPGKYDRTATSGGRQGCRPDGESDRRSEAIADMSSTRHREWH
jgi:hypothetical protein